MPARTTSRADRPPARGRALAAAAVAVSLLVLSACGLPWAGPDCDEYRFDARAWGKGPGQSFDTPTRRQRIADALVKCRRLQGLDREAVRRMLGPADDRSLDRTVSSWVLGAERGYGVDYESLEVSFDATGRVRDARVAKD